MRNEDLIMEVSKKFNKRKELVEILLTINEKEEEISFQESKSMIEGYFEDKIRNAGISNIFIYQSAPK